VAVASLEVEIVNKITNMNAFAEEKAAMSSLFQGGVFGQGAGGGLFLGAPGSGAAVENETKKAGAAFQEAETKLKNAVIVSGEAGSITDGLARKMNALGQLGITPMSVALIGGVVALGGLVEVGKSWIENSDKQEAATKSLAQAYATLGEKVPNQMIQDFITKNEKFIPSMYDAEQGFASLARAGFDYNGQLRLMNDAVDLAAAKNIPLSESVDVLIKAHGGQTRALADLGITIKNVDNPLKDLTEAHKKVSAAANEHTKAYDALISWELKHHDRSALTAADLFKESELYDSLKKSTDAQTTANQDLTTAQGEVNAKGDQWNTLLAQLESKISKARETTSDLHQNSNKLNIEWQKLSNDNGPNLAGMLGAVEDKMAGAVGKTDDFLQLLRNSDWGGFSNVLVTIAGGIHDVTDAIGGANQALQSFLSASGGNPSGATRMNPYGNRTSTASRNRGFGGRLPQ
jgi:hypothetical protein